MKKGALYGSADVYGKNQAGVVEVGPAGLVQGAAVPFLFQCPHFFTNHLT